MQDLSSPPEIEPVTPPEEAWSPNHWTAKEFPHLTNTDLLQLFEENKTGSRVRERGWRVEVGVPSIGVCYYSFFCFLIVRIT